MKNYHQVHFQFDPSRKLIWQEIVGYLERYLPSRDRILDLGAGYCDLINALDGKEKTAIDIWPEFVKYADPQVRTVLLDLRRGLKSIPGKFDLILASNLLEHLSVSQVNRLLSDIYHILEPGGHLVLIQPNFRINPGNYFNDYTHQSIFTDFSLSRLLMAHDFHLVRIEPRFLPLTLESRLPKWSWLVKLYLSFPFRPFAGQMLIIARK